MALLLELLKRFKEVEEASVAASKGAEVLGGRGVGGLIRGLMKNKGPKALKAIQDTVASQRALETIEKQVGPVPTMPIPGQTRPSLDLNVQPAFRTAEGEVVSSPRGTTHADAAAKAFGRGERLIGSEQGFTVEGGTPGNFFDRFEGGMRNRTRSQFQTDLKIQQETGARPNTPGGQVRRLDSTQLSEIPKPRARHLSLEFDPTTGIPGRQQPGGKRFASGDEISGIGPEDDASMEKLTKLINEDPEPAAIFTSVQRFTRFLDRSKLGDQDLETLRKVLVDEQFNPEGLGGSVEGMKLFGQLDKVARGRQRLGALDIVDTAFTDFQMAELKKRGLRVRVGDPTQNTVFIDKGDDTGSAFQIQRTLVGSTTKRLSVLAKSGEKLGEFKTFDEAFGAIINATN